MSRGKKGNALGGAAVGASVGLGAALVTVATQSDAGIGAPALAALALVVYPAQGALLGLRVGALIRTERWEEVPVRSVRWSVGAIPSGGVGIRVSF